VANGIQLEGFEQLDQVLAGLGLKLGAQVVDKVLRKAAAPLVRRAKELSSNADVTGETTKSIGIIANKKTNSITVGPRRGGQFKGYTAHLLEYGTAPHIIKAKAGGGLLAFGGTFTKEVQHPGIAAQPFIRPAFDATKGQVVESVKSQLAEIIATQFKSVFK